jgi:hypothetical protein
MSLLKVNDIQTIGGTPNRGKILQVVQTYYDIPTVQSISAQNYTDITGMTVSITPSSTSSKILVHARWYGENATNWDSGYGLKRNGTIIGAPGAPGARNASMTIGNLSYHLADDNNSTPETAQFWYLDSPNSTSSTTYTMWYANINALTLYTNRTIGDLNQFNYERGTCAMILMEVSA